MINGVFKTEDPDGKIKEYKVVTVVNVDDIDFLVYTQNVENNKNPDLLVNSIEFDEEGKMELGKVTTSQFEKVLKMIDKKVNL